MKLKKLSKTELRGQAEVKLGLQKQTILHGGETDTQRLLHELEVHQIELEMQNEELMKTRADLEAAFRQYTDLYDFAPVGYFTLARDSTIRQANLAGANLLDVEHNNLLHHRLDEFISDESLVPYNTFFGEILSGDGEKTCELAFKGNEKGILWARLKATCFEGGEECRVTLTDITQQRQLEQTLRESERRFRTTLQDVPTIAVQGYTLDGITRYWNLASKNLYGYSEQEAIGQNLMDLIVPPEMRSEFWQAIQQMAESGQPIPAAEWSLMRKDGSRVTVYSSHVIVSVPGRPVELFCLDIDLTERKRIAALLQARVRISEFSDSHTLNEALQKTLDEAEALTGSQVSFAYFLEADQKTPALQMWSTNTLSEMRAAEKDGMRYGVDRAGVWKDCLSKRIPQISNDYPKFECAKELPQDFTPTLRVLVIPVFHHERIVMVMGVGNKPTDYHENDIKALSQLANTVWDVVQRKRAEQALQTANTELQATLAREQQLSRTDPLTGVRNRRYLYELAEHEFKVAARYHRSLSVIMFDLDHFKKINDLFSHMVGDQILERVTQVASAALRSSDVIGRYGGEEFIIIMPMTNAQQAYSLAERIRINVEAIRVPTPKGDASVTISTGIVEVLHNKSIESVDDVFRRADKAMYAAKQAGRNRTEIDVL